MAGHLLIQSIQKFEQGVPMHYRRTSNLSKAGNRLLFAVLSLAIAVGCTRDPYDAGSEAEFNEAVFDFQVLLTDATIWDVEVASSSDGRIGAAVITGGSEVIVLEGTGGSWSEISTLSGSDLLTSTVRIAPGVSGAWWILASSATSGMKLYRVGNGIDSTLTIPSYSGADWDTIGAAIASDSGGMPTLIVRAVTVGLIRAALSDTGWALGRISGSTLNSSVFNYVLGADGDQHLLFRSLSGGQASYQYVDPDSNITTEQIPRTETSLSFTLGSDGIPYIVGPLTDVNYLVFWTIPVGLDRPESILLWDAFLSNSAATVVSDSKPYLACAKYQGPQRFNLYMATRPSDAFNINWEFITIMSNAAWKGLNNRMMSFELVQDSSGMPHFFFITGTSGSPLSNLHEAVLK